jgi:hypothetical protein
MSGKNQTIDGMSDAAKALRGHRVDASTEGQDVWRSSIYSGAGISHVYADARAGNADAIEIARLFTRPTSPALSTGTFRNH